MPPRAWTFLVLSLVQFFFGAHYFAAKALLEFIPPRPWAVIRAAGAATLLLLLARSLGRPLPWRARELAPLAGLSVFGVVINQVCFVEGLHRTSPAHASILMTSIPVGTLLFGVLLRRERLSPRKLLSLALAFAGVLLVIFSKAELAQGLWASRAIQVRNTGLGDILTLANALSYSLFLVLSKRILERVDALGATAVLLACGTVGIAALGAPALARLDPAGVPLSVWLLAAFIIVFPTALAYLMIYWALAREGSYLVALFIYLQPLFATLLSVAFFGERPTPALAVGAASIFAGVYVAVREGAPPAVEPGGSAGASASLASSSAPSGSAASSMSNSGE